MNNRFFSGLVPVLVLVVLWEAVARLHLAPGTLLFPPFTEVVGEFFSLASSGVLGKNFVPSLVRVLIGFTAGSIGGFIVGTLMGWKRVVEDAFGPIISLLYPIPALGWLPLLMLWIGINELLPVTVIFIACFFPVCYNTITGIRGIDPSYIRAARTLGATEWHILAHVIIPLALPNIFTGLRLVSGMAWRVMIAAEMVAIPTGIGSLLMQAESLVRVDIIIVCLITLSIMCLIFERFFIYVEHTLTARWRR
ncbi:MAG: ABC transporter permease [Deltaproteobacteria bacterium]|nr:ABC transporter permease [Deltaproteobacteria bacterium]